MIIKKQLKLFPLNLKSLIQYNNKTIKLNTYETNRQNRKQHNNK